MVAPILFILMLAGDVPTLDLQSTCRGAESAAAASDRATAYQSCLRDEQTARQQLQQKWNSIPLAARTGCTDEATGISPSYVELLTCLEMRTGGNFSGGAAGLVPATPGSPPLNPEIPAMPSPTGSGTTAAPGPALPGTTGAISSTPASPVPNSTAPNASVGRALAPPPPSTGAVR
ncbi:MAG: hypothetical protein JO273_24395 [Methylobacteriaceae bacterium]|nr:hypothetical protein [Methylobacteriaceae bacterium]